ncbi:MAG TPA: HTH domain-containing protein [Anaerovoracaceae bacterium]|nr:HTH domain-containing protein [Anaerovoracaceae bacterium]
MEYVLNDKVLKVIEIYNRPVTAREIANEMDISMQTVYGAIQQLLREGKIEEYSSEDASLNNSAISRKINYYAVAQSNLPIVDSRLDSLAVLTDKYNSFSKKLSQEYVNLDTEIREQTNLLEARVNELENSTKNIYASIISIMGVFVAIFSLIILNISVVSESINGSTMDLLIKLVVLNIPLVGTIIILLFAVKYLIITPLCKSSKGDNGK